MDEKSRPLTDKVWSKLDRKATAILELTLRQYRTRLSTWTVFGVGIILILITSLFYIEAMNNPDVEMIDNDNDSIDSDGDGYPDGQENLLGTSIYDADNHPGLFDPPILPDSPDDWINEGGDYGDYGKYRSRYIHPDYDGNWVNYSFPKDTFHIYLVMDFWHFLETTKK